MPAVVGEPDMDDVDDMMIFPLTDIDNNSEDADTEDDSQDFYSNHRQGDRRNGGGSGNGFRASVTLRQRRWSKLGLGTGPLLKLNAEIPQVQQQPTSSEPELSASSSPRLNWQKALKKIRSLKDPWAKYRIDQRPTEKVKRHRYNALKKQWVRDEVKIKVETEPFNHGAMRECFRLKKLSSFAKKIDWKNAQNYVAKSYMEKVDRDVYFEDVHLQMDAKLWGEEYNRHNPPKKVDIFQMSIIEFLDRPGSPLFHLEHYIEGHYIKYNSNSGFVDENLRLTPQAFSHFTFERSGHQLIIVDIQGVGDLWTDPQIHTSEGLAYGDGNLGAKGMALFFHSHVCNEICDSLDLTKFDLASSEHDTQKEFIKTHQQSCQTVVRHAVEPCLSASPMERGDLTSFLERSRQRTTSMCSSVLSGLSEEEDTRSRSPTSPVDMMISPRRLDESWSPRSSEPMCISPLKPARVRFLSESDDSQPATVTEDDDLMTPVVPLCCTPPLYTFHLEEERIRFQQMASRGARPSCVAHEINLRNLGEGGFRVGDSMLGMMEEESILGKIHHEMAKYHEIGRFAVNPGEIDIKAAIYHEQQAADLGVKEAILTMANMYLGIQHDVLVNVTVEDTEENINYGMDYMQQAAEVGDRSAMIFIAKAFQSGFGLGTNRSVHYGKAAEWFERAINMMQSDESGEYDATMDTPVYQLQALVAELYLTGGPQLTKDPSYSGDLYNEAAEAAMASMKGRLANKYYALAEEAYALIEEE